MQDNSKLKRLLYWFIEYVSGFRNATIIACGKGEYEEALKLSSKCAYINNGIDIHYLKDFLKEQPSINVLPIVCTSGRICYQKNPKLFNDIANLLPQIKFLWIGEGELSTELVAPNIEITGWVNQKTAIELMANADFFLLPSLWEGLSISLLEAMYLKKICLVSNVVGNRDVVENERNGFICITAEEYAQRIRQILQTNCNWQSIVTQAQNDVVTRYNTDVMVAQYKKIYSIDR
jgi:glycosyltransferase involved in cell wall biosynthesis